MAKKKQGEPTPLFKVLEGIAHRHQLSTVFDDFLTMAVCAFGMGTMEERYMQTIEKYERDELMEFPHAMNALIREYTAAAQDGGWRDILGEMFEEYNSKFTRDAGGQFFTPKAICDVMAITCWEQPDDSKKDETTVCDPTCGSGRNLIAYDRRDPRNRFRTFYSGMDLDQRCVKMCVLNFFMYGMRGVVIHMDSLAMKIYGGYRVFTPETMMGIRPLSVEECKPYVYALNEAIEEPPIVHLPVPDKGEQLKLFGT